MKKPKHKKKDKKDYIIALLTITCSFLIFLLLNKNMELQKENAGLEENNSGLRSKNASLTSSNTLKGIKLDALQAQIDDLTKSLQQAGSAQRIANNMTSAKVQDQRLSEANQKIKDLEKSIDSVVMNSQKEIQNLLQKNADLQAKLTSTEAMNQKEKIVYKPVKTTSSYRKPSSYKPKYIKKVEPKKVDKLLGDMYEE